MGEIDQIKKFYFQDQSGELKCCHLIPQSKTEDASDGSLAIYQVICDEAFGWNTENPNTAGVVVYDHGTKSYVFHPYRYDQIGFGEYRLLSNENFFTIDPRLRLEGFYNEDSMYQNISRDRWREHHKPYAYFKDHVPELRLELGAGASVPTTDETSFTLGPAAGITAFFEDGLFGAKLKYRQGFVLPDGRGDSLNNVDFLASAGFVLLPWLRLELNAGRTLSFCNGSSCKDIQASSIADVGPFNYYSTNAVVQPRNSIAGFNIELGTGPVERTIHRDICGVKTETLWPLSVMIFLTIDLTDGLEIITEPDEVIAPVCKKASESQTPLPDNKLESIKKNYELRLEEERKRKQVQDAPAETENPVPATDDEATKILRKRLQPYKPVDGYNECRLIETIELDVKFEQGSTKLTAYSLGAVKTLAEITADAMRDMKKIGRSIQTIEIHGYTSSEGDDSLNLELSQQRAATVARELRNNGIGVTIQAVGHGEDPKYLRYKPDGTEDPAASRRVEVKFILDTSW